MIKTLEIDSFLADRGRTSPLSCSAPSKPRPIQESVRGAETVTHTALTPRIQSGAQRRGRGAARSREPLPRVLEAVLDGRLFWVRGLGSRKGRAGWGKGAVPRGRLQIEVLLRVTSFRASSWVLKSSDPGLSAFPVPFTLWACKRASWLGCFGSSPSRFHRCGISLLPFCCFLLA